MDETRPRWIETLGGLLLCAGLFACGPGFFTGGSDEPTIEYLLVLNQNDNRILSYRFDPESGGLSAVDEVAVATGPVRMLPNPDLPEILYVSGSSATVESWRIAPESGILSLVGSLSVGNSPAFMGYHDETLYITDQGTDELLRHDIESDGSVGSSAASPVAIPSINSGLGYHSNGFFYAISNGDVLRSFDSALTILGADSTTGSGPVDVLINPQASYAVTADSVGHTVTTYPVESSGNAGSGSNTPLAGCGPRSLAMNAKGTLLWVACQVSGEVISLGFDSESGVTGTIGSVSAGGDPEFILLHRSEEFLFVSDYNTADIRVFHVNADGTLSETGSVPAGSGSAPANVHMALVGF